MDSRQTLLLNEVARRINASLELQPTLETIVAAAAELIPCALAEVSLWDEESGMLTLQAIRCEPERTFPVGQSFPPGEGYTGWLVRHRRPLLVPDVDACHDIRPHLLPGELPFQAYAGVPLLAGDRLVGTLVLVADQRGAFDEEDMRLLEALAHHATTAIGNARLYGELGRRHRELSALNAVAFAINQPLSLQEILDEAVARVVEVTGTSAGGIRLLERDSGDLVLISYLGFSPEYIEQVGRIPVGEGIVGRVAASEEPLVVDDIARDPRSWAGPAAAREGYHTFAIVPLRARDEIVGTLGVVTRGHRTFGREEMALLEAIGNQLGSAIANARLREEALRAEQLVAVGRVAASVAHDLRSPLGGIVRSAEFLARPEISLATREKLSGAIVSLARRLMNSTQEILDYARGECLPLQRVPCSLAAFLDDVLPVMEVDFSDRGIEVVRDCHYGGGVVMDAERMAQVVYNIGANARDAMSHGGTLRVSTCEKEGRVELRFADTGPGVPAEVRERIFEPFFSYGKREGAGLGLSIARRIVEEHGGELWVEGDAEPGATFVIALPL